MSLSSVMSLQSAKQELSLPIGTLSSSSISSMGTCDEKKSSESEPATLATSAERPSVTFAPEPTVTKTMDSEEDEEEDKEEEDKEEEEEKKKAGRGRRRRRRSCPCSSQQPVVRSRSPQQHK